MDGCGGKRKERFQVSGYRLKYYRHALTDQQANLLQETGYFSQLKRSKSGASVQFDPEPSPVPGMKIVILYGTRNEIKEEVKVISQETGSKGTLSEQAQAFWIRWVWNTFPDLDHRAYFQPPLYFNRQLMTEEFVAGQKAKVLLPAPSKIRVVQTTATSMSEEEGCSHSNQLVTYPAHAAQASILKSVQKGDERDDAAMRRVLTSLQELSDITREVLVGMTQLRFDQYLGEPFYAVAASEFPHASNLPPSFPKNWRQGDFDVLLIHRHYGLLVFEVKAIGDSIQELNMTQNDEDYIRQKLKVAVKQLNKAEAMLSHLVSDLTPGQTIIKTIAVPNLTAHQIRKAINGDPELKDDLSRCLDSIDFDITDLFLCSNNLPDPTASMDINEKALKKLKKWWKKLVEGASDSDMTFDIYEKLVARFCGPATTVTIACVSPPRYCIKTMPQAICWTGTCYAKLILFPEQVDLLNGTLPRVFLAGPPGTGKTVMLQLKGMEWLQGGHNVYVVSTWLRGHAVCKLLYNMLSLQESTKTGHGRLYLELFDFGEDFEDPNEAVNCLSQKAKDGCLHVIIDEVGGNFRNFCFMLLEKVPNLNLWAASCFDSDAPSSWTVKILTKMLRSPPTVAREVELNEYIKDGYVKSYSEHDVPDLTNGPTVKRVYHKGPGHFSDKLVDCTMCARELASFLHSLRIPESSTPGSTTTPSGSHDTKELCLKWKDVIVLNKADVVDNSCLVKELRAAGIPVEVTKKEEDIEDVAMARSDVVWATDGRRVRGLERKVVVCLGSDAETRLHFMSRCTSQLVIVSPDDY